MEDLTVGLLGVLGKATFPGALGGLTIFLLGIKRGHFKHNRLLVKGSVEVLGGMIVASFLFFDSQPYVAFVIGLTWSGLVQTLRQRVTAAVEAALTRHSEDG